MENSDLVNSRIKWFKALVPHKYPSEHSGYVSQDLISYSAEKDLERGLVVCAITCNDHHIFALFPDYIAFAKFHLSLSRSKRCFFEIIFGER